VCCNISVILIKFCTFVGSNCSKRIIMHGTENVKFPAESISVEIEKDLKTNSVIL
jgi:hypothetical protein